MAGATFTEEQFDLSLEECVLTDKAMSKRVPCKACRRACVIHAFAPNAVLCSTCKSGNSGAGSSPGTVASPEPGVTDPAKAVNLVDCLLNPTFAHAHCPHDPEHAMELKSVSHAPNYGPRKLLKYDAKGVPVYHQETGETVMHQCAECGTVVTYSTQHTHQYRRQNEPRVNDHKSGTSWESLLGTREAA